MLSFSGGEIFEAFAIVFIQKNFTISGDPEEFSLVDITRDGGEETSKILCIHKKKKKKNTGKTGKVNFFRNQN